MMTSAYIFLAYASDTSNGAKIWMFGGLVFVMLLWWIFRRVTLYASLARALAVGDADHLILLADEQLARRSAPDSRAPFLVYRGLALELRGEWEATLATLHEAGEPKDATLRRLAAAARIAALVETREIGRAKEIFERELAPSRALLGGPRDVGGPTDLVVRLAEGRICVAAGEYLRGQMLLGTIIADIRAGSAMRATAHRYLARVATAAHDATATATHVAAAAKQAPTAWVARPDQDEAQNEPLTAKPS
jgi:hypothetical protein